MAKGKNYLKGRFETGDVPSQSDFEDLIDSAVNLADDVDGTIPDSPAAGHVPTSGAVKSYVAAEVAKLPSKAEVTQLSLKVSGLETSKTAMQATDASLQKQINELTPAVVEGDVTNNPDNEDLEAVNGLLKLKDRSTATSSKGYVILRRGVALSTQMTATDTIYEVRYNFDLGGGTLTIPTGCTLRFDGGKLDNGKVVFNGCKIEDTTDCIFGASLNVCYVEASWDGKYNDRLVEDAQGNVGIVYKSLPNRFAYRTTSSYTDVANNSVVDPKSILDLKRAIFTNKITADYIRPDWFEGEKTAPIQKAIDMAVSSSVFEVKFLPKEYELDDTIKVRSGVILMGCKGGGAYLGGSYQDRTYLVPTEDTYATMYASADTRNAKVESISFKNSEVGRISCFWLGVLNISTSFKNCSFRGHASVAAYIEGGSLYTDIESCSFSITHDDEYFEKAVLFKEDIAPSSVYYGTNHSHISLSSLSAYEPLSMNGGLLYVDSCDIENGYGKKGVVSVGEYSSSATNIIMRNSYFECTPLSTSSYANSGTDFPVMFRIKQGNAISLDRCLVYAQSLGKGAIFSTLEGVNTSQYCSIVASNCKFYRSYYLIFNLRSGSNFPVDISNSNVFDAIFSLGVENDYFDSQYGNNYIRRKIHQLYGVNKVASVSCKGNYIPVCQGNVFKATKNSTLENVFESSKVVGSTIYIYGENVTLKHRSVYYKRVFSIDITKAGEGYKVTPKISVSGGNNVSLIPCFRDGKLVSVFIESGGTSVPSSATATVKNIGNTTDATLSLTITSGVITAVEVTNQGEGYDTTEASIQQDANAYIYISVEGKNAADTRGNIRKAYIGNAATGGSTTARTIVTNISDYTSQCELTPVVSGAIRTYKGKDVVLHTIYEFAVGVITADYDLYIYAVYRDVTHEGRFAYAPSTLDATDVGEQYFDTNTKQMLFWDGSAWRDGNGVLRAASVKLSGTFDNKPTVTEGAVVGQRYFCTDKQTTEGATNGIVIYHKGNNVWVDALGRIVS